MTVVNEEYVDKVYADVAAAGSLDELRDLEIKYLGRKSPINVAIKEEGRRRKEEREILQVIATLEIAYEKRLGELCPAR